MMQKQLLLVDDEPGIRKVVGIALKDLGYTVLEAANGDEGLDVFRSATPPIVITDIRMPGMDGLDLLRAIKSERPATEVILVTGHGDMDVAIEGLRLDACDFISKPVGPEVLEIALKRAEDKIAMRERMRAYTDNLESLVRDQADRLVEMERRSIAQQAVDGMSQLLGGLSGEVEGDMGLLNSLPCMVSIQDREQRVVSANIAYRERLDVKIGQPGFSIYTKHSRDGQDSPVARTLRTGLGQKSQEGIFGPDESLSAVTVHTAPIRGTGGDIDLVLELIVESSEIQRLQDELRTSRHRYQQLFDDAPCYITVLDRGLRIQAANHRFRQEFAFAPGGLCYQAYCISSRPCFGCPTLKTFETGQSHRLELSVRGKDGEPINLMVWTAPIRNASGEIEAVMEMATDITEYVRMQDHLASLGMLLASLSHGIKGLLTALDGGVYKVNAGFRTGDQEKIQTGWSRVTELIGRIRTMVLDILFYAKERELQLKDIPAADLIKQIVDAVRPKAEGCGVEFHTDISPNLGNFQVDEIVLSAALVNILENAVEACKEVHREPGGQVELRARPDASGVFFEVEDNGVGMSEETLSRLFTVFFSTKGSRGTGLGLFIAKKAVDQHGGRIGAVSEPGQGSIFRIWIPR
jgi:signal transduction histidine kinase/FixJ family two-component response regulator